jgi:hypothetical protein
LIAGEGTSVGIESPGCADDEDDTPAVAGYSVEPQRQPRSGRTGKPKQLSTSLLPPRAPAGAGVAESGSLNRAPMADGVLPPLSHPEARALVSILYPLRSAEAMAMVAIPAIAFWGFTILVPEYCLGVWADADMMGTPSMGMLVILISALPASLLLPLIVIYMLQYLGRILVSSAMGDTVPPRTPDRNFEGFLSGLHLWFVWLVLGVGVGFLPLALSMTLEGQSISAEPLLMFGLIMSGIIYSQVALLMTFLHDSPLAANPPRVIGAILRHGGSLFPTLLKTSVILGLETMAVVFTLALRASHYWLYLLMGLGCWSLAIWAAFVTLRILGLHCFHDKDSLT